MLPLTEQAILLDARVASGPDVIDTPDRATSPVSTDETHANTIEAEPTTQSEAQSTVASRSQSPIPVPEPRAATAVVPARSPTPERPTVRPVRAASDPNPRSRFSTVVDRPSNPYAPSAVLDDARPLPASAISTEPAPTHPSRVQNDEQFSREAEVILNEARDLHRRAEDVMRSLEASELPPSPSLSAADLPREEIRHTPCDAATDVTHDVEPPFLTDGRGRVVWSNATAVRHREGRRVRSSTAPGSSQQKARRDVPDIETASARNAAEEAGDNTVRQTSRPRATRSPTSGDTVEGESGGAHSA